MAKAETPVVASEIGGQAAAKGARNRFVPNTNATGAHSVYRRDPLTNKITHYETYQPQTNPFDPKTWESVKRFDGTGVGHTNKFLQTKIETPHMHDPLYPGGVRPAYEWEIPR